ncbi:MAG: thermonuclease family protein [Deltaproteobacteria bacterium]|nr:thermonuclease family protein [Deltaproteobacteria bacterium]
MVELADASVDLVVTSPPYWHIKDYAAPHQIGFGQNLHAYLKDVFRVWQECYRVLKPGRRLCVNVGDQFARAALYGRYKIIPIHAEFIIQAEHLGFDYRGGIIWQKKTTMNTTGGATVMGSYPYPPNGLIEIDYEFILIFKKPGPPTKVPAEVKAASRLTKEEWKEYFSGHWRFGGAKKAGHEAAFPLELPRRLIRMFSFVGETVLDPFLGSGTTLQAARQCNCQGVGYEINEDFLEAIEAKAGEVEVIRRTESAPLEPVTGYRPAIPDTSGPVDEKGFKKRQPKLRRVRRVIGPDRIGLDGGQTVRLRGLVIDRPEEARAYLEEKIKGKEVFLRFDAGQPTDEEEVAAYVYLKNRIFINAHLIKTGLASVDQAQDFGRKAKFLKIQSGRG